MTSPGTRRQLLRGLRRGGTGSTDDNGSLILALLLTMMGVLLSGVMLPMVLTQIGSTRADIKRVNSLNAAQAGLDVGLGHIRAADDGTGTGALARLPCGTMTGDVGAGGIARYQVTVDYFALDPKGKSDSWITANRILCLAGGGTQSTPRFALLRSQGTDEPTGSFDPAATDAVATRTLRGTYTFQSTNQNVAGGLIHVYKTATSNDLCMDAGSGSPTAGTNLQMHPCNPGSSRQTFAYNTNLTLVLASSQTPLTPLGMCLDAGAAHAVNDIVRFQPCASTTQPRQQWSINDNANFEGTTDGLTLDNYCFNVQSQDSPGSFVILGNTAGSDCHRGYDNIETFSPDAAVGAGAAGPGANQLVNFDQFGRCLDVTEQNVNKSFLISWPCKQAPNPANVTWNQKWAMPALTGPSGTGRVTTTYALLPYCLRSPGSTATGQYVTVELCPLLGTPMNMTWTVSDDTGSYAISYVIEDGYGYCLAPTDPAATPPDFYASGQQISKIVVAVCDGSTLQKWNAPPSILQAPPLKDVGEK